MGGSSTAPGAAEQYCPTCERSFVDAGDCPDCGTPLIALSQKDQVIGRTLDDRYTVIEKLGSGGMGAVYRATQTQLAREVAIKVVSPRLVSEPDAIKRFLREAKLASRLSHPNAVAVLDFGQSGDLFFLVMELLAGQTLEAVLDEHKVLPIDRAVAIATQICDALDGAHGLGIVHRDLKPANIMIVSGAGGRDLVKVLDFGLAKTIGGHATAVTQSGAMLGTPAYMPPELALGRDADGRADLYSLGCLLYVMLSGKLPFSIGSIHELVAKHAYEAPEPLDGLPPGLTDVVMKLLAKDPADRYPTAGATLAALAGAWNENAQDVMASLGTSVRMRINTPVALPKMKTPLGLQRAAANPIIPATAAPTGVIEHPRPRRTALLVGGAVVVAVGLGVGAFKLLRDDTTANPGVDEASAAEPVIVAPAVVHDAAPPAVLAEPTEAVDAEAAVASTPTDKASRHRTKRERDRDRGRGRERERDRDRDRGKPRPPPEQPTKPPPTPAPPPKRDGEMPF